MNDLRSTLDLAAGDGHGDADPATDLTRARSALTRRNRRRYSVGLAALAVVGAGSAGFSILNSGGDPAHGRDVAAHSRTSAGVTLVAATFDAAPYTFGLTPQGWSVQAQTPFAVTIVPDDGSASTSKDDFQGKLVIMFDGNPLDGRKVDRDGRSFWITGDSGYTTISTPTLAGEPDGVVRIQFPDNTGWDQDSMLAFLGSVHVGDGAVQGVG